MPGERFRLETEQTKLGTACSGDILRHVMVGWSLMVVRRTTTPTLLSHSLVIVHLFSSTRIRKKKDALCLPHPRILSVFHGDCSHPSAATQARTGGAKAQQGLIL